MPSLLGWALTFLFVMLTWVLVPGARASRRRFGYTRACWVWDGAEFAQVARHSARGRRGGDRPTAWTFVHKMPPQRWIAVAFAVLFVIVVFKIGDDANYEFIYFQF